MRFFTGFDRGLAMPEPNTEFKYPDNLKIVLPEPYLTAIGKVCVQWAHLEMAVELGIKKLAGFDLFDPRSAIVTAHMTWPLRMDILTALIAELETKYPHLAKFKDVAPLLKKASEGRNKIAHAFWTIEGGQVMILRATARGRLKTSMDPVMVSDIDAVVDDIGRAGAAMYKIILNK